MLELYLGLEHRPPEAMAEDGKKRKKQWQGLECPVCRCVFRIPGDHDGAGVLCPACNYLLQIPSPRSGGPTSGDQRSEITPGESAPLAAPVAEAESHAKTPPADPNQDKTTAWVIGASMLGLMAVGLSVWLLAESVHGAEQARDVVTSPAGPAAETSQSVVAKQPKDDQKNKAQQSAGVKKPLVHSTPATSKTLRKRQASSHAPDEDESRAGKAVGKEQNPAIPR